MTTFQVFTALYSDEKNAYIAVRDLLDAGFDREHINVITNNVDGRYTTEVQDDFYDVKADEGAVFGAVVGTLTGLGMALIPGVGPVFALGPLAAAVLAGGIGATAGAVTGGIAASLIYLGAPEDEAQAYQEMIRRGGTLVVVQAKPEWEHEIQEILLRHNPIDIKECEQHYRAEGWTGYDANASAYDPQRIKEYQEEMRHTYEEDDTTDVPAGRPYIRKYETDEPVYIQDVYEPEHRKDYVANFSDSGLTYDEVAPAYRFGQILWINPQYRDYTWDQLEPEARHYWEQQNPGTWENFRAVVRRSWERMKMTQ